MSNFIVKFSGLSQPLAWRYKARRFFFLKHYCFICIKVKELPLSLTGVRYNKIKPFERRKKTHPELLKVLFWRLFSSLSTALTKSWTTFGLTSHHRAAAGVRLQSPPKPCSPHPLASSSSHWPGDAFSVGGGRAGAFADSLFSLNLAEV